MCGSGARCALAFLLRAACWLSRARRGRVAACAFPIGRATGARMPADASTLRILGLEALLAAQRDRRLAPVERWDPPYCGDIGLKIRADGTWLYRGSPITRVAL